MTALQSVVEPTLRGMGFEVVDIQVSNHGRMLRIFIDRPGGVTVEHCAEASRHLSRVLEVEGVGYDRLEVSSPGLDRPLRKPADFARFAGQRVDVRMRSPDAGGRRRFVGLLRGLDGSAATVEVEGKAMTLELEGIERARLVPDLQARKGTR